MKIHTGIRLNWMVMKVTCQAIILKCVNMTGKNFVFQYSSKKIFF